MSAVEQAAEIVVGGSGAAPIVLSCEHASLRMPEPWSWPPEDAWVVGTHWSYDLGAAELTRELAHELGAAAVLSRFSRLLCDPNRAETDPSVFRDRADGLPLRINADLGEEERERRLAAYHRPYHAAVDRLVAAHPGHTLLSLHTFTPVYEGHVREVEVGVLFDTEEDAGIDLAVALADRGVPTWLNEPWSGKEGLIYSADRHARAHGRRALELEVRQDLAADPEWRARFVPLLAQALAEIAP